MTLWRSRLVRRRRAHDTGASAVEYALIVAGAAIGLFGVAIAIQRSGTAALTASSDNMNQAIVSASASTTAPPIPGVPTAPTASAGDGQVDLTWNTVSGATSYLVYGCGSSTIAVTSTSYTCTGLTNGTSYTFSVKAVNASGSSGQSSAVSATPLPPAPATPGGLVVTAGDRLVDVSWDSATGATGYKVYGCGASPVVITGTATTHACTGLTNGTTYSIYVTATNMGPESAPSTTVTATPHPPVVPVSWTHVVDGRSLPVDLLDLGVRVRVHAPAGDGQRGDDHAQRRLGELEDARGAFRRDRTTRRPARP